MMSRLLIMAFNLNEFFAEIGLRNRPLVKMEFESYVEREAFKVRLRQHVQEKLFPNQTMSGFPGANNFEIAGTKFELTVKDTAPVPS